MKKSDATNVLVTMALRVESQGLFEEAGIDVLYTGLGKVNAAYSLGRRLVEIRVRERELPLVVNFGTAGSRRFDTGELVACETFVQRDMDVTGLGFAHGVTPFEEIPPVLEFPSRIDHLTRGICGSGDRFETGQSAVPCDVIDMEAYALAKVCLFEGAEFACVKFITDGADEDAAGSWEANLQTAARAFLDLYEGLFGA